MNKTQVFAVALLCTLCFSGGYILNRTFVTQRHGVTRAEANLFVFAETVDGTYELYSGNVITNIGENQTRCFHSRNMTSTYALYWISIGNVTAGATKTQLDSEFDRQQGTISEWVNDGDYALNSTYKFNFASAVITNSSGIHWNSAGDGNLYACANYAQTSWAINDNCTILWSITYNAN